MKTKLNFLWMLLLMLVGGVNGAWAAEVTFYFSVNSDTEKEDITITGGKYDNSKQYYGISSGSSFTVSSSNGNITAISISYVSNADNRIGGTVTANVGTYTNSGPTTVGTWTGNDASVTFSTTNSARITQITVTYSATSLLAVSNKTWNFSDWEVNSYTTTGNIIDNLEVNGSSSSSKQTEIRSKSQTFGEDNYTKALFFAGSGNTSSTNIHFKVTGSCKVTIYAYNDGDNSRSLGLHMNGSEVSSTSIASKSQTTITYDYSGDATDAYIYSKNSNLYVFALKVEPATGVNTTINIFDLCYEHRYYGQDLNRNVAGFDLTATGNIQSYNSGSPTVTASKLIYRSGATVRIQPNSSNSSARITRVSFTGAGFPDGSGGYTATSIVAYDGEGLEYIEFTNTTDDKQMEITSLTITTDRAMTWSKVTPAFAFSPTSGTYTAGSGEQNLGDLNTGTLRTNSPTAFRLNYAIVNPSSEGIATCSYHMSGKYLGITPLLAGTGTLRATYNNTDANFTSGTNPYYNAISQDFTFTVNAATNTFTGTYDPVTSTELYQANGNAIPSNFPGGTVEGGKYLIDGKERNLMGTYTFTSTSGTMTPGTDISEIPGLKATFGVSGEATNWTVGTDGATTSVAAVRTSSNNWIPTGGCFLKFEPYVNGILTLNGNFPAGNEQSSNACVQEVNNDETLRAWLNAPTSDVSTFNVTMVAGRKYYVYCQKSNLVLKSFTFQPAFLTIEQDADEDRFAIGDITDVEASRDVNSPVTANLTTNIAYFPHLISSDDGEGKVKFAGDRSIVNLYPNNNVDLLDNGSTIIKGTVLKDGSDRELFAYYFLQSNILKLENIKMQPDRDTNYENASVINDQDYVTIANPDTYSGSLVFHFNNPIARAFAIDNTTSAGVKFRILGGNASGGFATWTNINNVTWTSDEDGANNNFRVYVGDLVEGKTYQFIIESNVLKKGGSQGDDNVLNSEIFISFTVNKTNEAQIKMIYPSGIATVGTSIVLATYKDGSETDVVVDKNHIVTAVLTAQDGGKVAADENDNSTSMSITGSFSGNHLIFKPTKTLRSNTTYVLTINPTQVYLEGTPTYSVTTLKEFIFTTGAAAGSEPLKSSTNPVENAVVSVRSGNIYFTFDQVVELEPFSEVYATPINGSEATANGKTGLDVTNFTDCTLKVSESDDKTIYFPYSTDQLKYDLYYRVVIPANTVIGTGGKPNSAPIELNFRMGKNPSASEVTASTFYPHTWDFCKFGNQSTVGTTAYNIINGSRDPGSGYRINSLYSGTEEGYTTYKTKNQSGYGFDQGADIYFNYKYAEGSATQDNMDEFEGIRISLVDTRSNRFEIRNVTSNGGTKNSDGTDKWIFRMNGNTHYMTLSNVPAGKLYMVVNSKLLGINSPNATFEENAAFTATTHDNNTRITNTNGIRKLVLNVSEAGDVVFCVGDFSCEKIGVSTENRIFYGTFSIDNLTYATDCRSYPVRYELVNAFTDDVVKGYYVNSIEDNVASPHEVETAWENAGTIVILQSGVSSGSSSAIPIFKTDVNTSGSTKTNYLHGTVAEKTDFSNPEGTKYFFSNLYKQLNKDKTAFADNDAPFITANQMGFYRAIGNYVSANKAWLDTSSSPNGWDARLYVMFGLFDVEDAPTAVNTISSDEIEDGKWYTIQGVRVTHPEKGNLYIHNGKKVVIK